MVKKYYLRHIFYRSEMHQSFDSTRVIFFFCKNYMARILRRLFCSVLNSHKRPADARCVLSIWTTTRTSHVRLYTTSSIYISHSKSSRDASKYLLRNFIFMHSTQINPKGKDRHLQKRRINETNKYMLS